MKTFIKPEVFPIEIEATDYVEIIEINKFIELTGTPNDIDSIKPLDIGKMRQWDEYPYLIVDPDTLEILGYEGGHRLMAMQLAGYTHAEIIIQIQPNPKRFSIMSRADMARLANWKWNGIKPVIADIKTNVNF